MPTLAPTLPERPEKLKEKPVPPIQKPNSFTIDDAVAKIGEMAGAD